MTALSNIGGALQSAPTTRVPCSNAAKTRNSLKLAGVNKLANRSQPLVGRSSPYCGDMYCRGDIANANITTSIVCGELKFPTWILVRQALWLHLISWNRAGQYTFAVWFLSYIFFFFTRLISAVADWMSAILLHIVWPWCEFRMQVWNVLHATRWKLQDAKTRMWANAQRDSRPALPNIGGALCSTPQSLADAHY